MGIIEVEMFFLLHYFKDRTPYIYATVEEEKEMEELVEVRYISCHRNANDVEEEKQDDFIFQKQHIFPDNKEDKRI
jgi:hypothetical protein